MRSMVEGPLPESEEPLHRAAPKVQFILSAAAGGVEGRGPPPREISGRILGRESRQLAFRLPLLFYETL